MINPQAKKSLLRRRFAITELAVFPVAILALGLFLAPKTSNAWWDSNWQNRRQITFDNGSSTAALTDFPVLVLLNSSNIDYAKTQDSGQDIRFVDSDDSTALNYEIDRWDETATSSVWVKIPSIATGTADSIYMYYNNTGASDGQNATGTWDSNSVYVSHFNANNGSSTDATANANNGTVTGAVATTTDAIAGYGKYFDGVNDHIITPTSTSLNNIFAVGSRVGTISFWASMDTPAASSLLIAKDGNGGNVWQLFAINQVFRFRHQWSSAAMVVQSVTPIATSTRFHIAVTYDGNATSNSPYFFLNGLQEATTSIVAAAGTISSDATRDLWIGESSGGTSDARGKFDEIRLSNTDRSADWIRAEYKNGINRYNTFGGEESSPPPGAARSRFIGWGIAR